MQEIRIAHRFGFNQVDLAPQEGLEGFLEAEVLLDEIEGRMPLERRPPSFPLWVQRITLYAILSCVIVAFHDQCSEDIFNGKRSRAARATCPETLWRVARRKLDQLNQAADFRDLRLPPGNRLEALTQERQGQHSIHINDQYRICFVWTLQEPTQVELTDYH